MWQRVHFLSLEMLFTAIRPRQSKPRQNRFARKLLEFFNLKNKRQEWNIIIYCTTEQFHVNILQSYMNVYVIIKQWTFYPLVDQWHKKCYLLCTFMFTPFPSPFQLSCKPEYWKIVGQCLHPEYFQHKIQIAEDFSICNYMKGMVALSTWNQSWKWLLLLLLLVVLLWNGILFPYIWTYYILELSHLHFQNPNTLCFRTKFVTALSNFIWPGNPSESSLKCPLY